MAASKHPRSITLDHCWVCGTKFVDSGGPEVRHEHHMIPKAFGGADGPTVSVCDTHHSKLHRIAECLRFGKPYFAMLKGEEQSAKKLLYLANIVYNAELAARNDPNKAASVILTLNARQKHQIDSLKRVYPKAKSRPELLALALESLYRKHFTS